MGVLADVVDLIKHLGDALDNLTHGLQRSINRSYESFDYIAARRAKLALTKLHKYGTEFGVMQSQVPERFLWYAGDPGPERWAEIQKDLAKVVSAIPDIAGEASKADSAFVLEDVYKRYILTMRSRKSILEKLLSSPAPSTCEELAELSDIRTEYLRLMENLEHCQGWLSRYIQAKFPGRKSDFSLDELPEAEPDDRSIWNDPHLPLH